MSENYENLKLAAPEGSFDDDVIEVNQINNEDPRGLLAHIFEKKERSSDVVVVGRESKIDFSGLNLSEEMLDGLTQCGFVKPSPIQLRSIPIGNCGIDLLLQAKSGTGKTLVFSIIALEKVNPNDNFIQAVVLAPTREIAYQISEVMKLIGAYKNVTIKNFTGGLPIMDDIGNQHDSHIVCGTPGRITHLVRDYGMDLSKVNLFVLDEADKLLETSFFDDLNVIIEALPKEKQFIAASATYQKGMEDFLVKLMKNPYKIELNKTIPILVAIDHFVLDCRKYTNTKGKLTQDRFYEINYHCIKEILGQIPYTRAVIFCGSQSSAETVYDQFQAEDIDVVLLSAQINQRERIKSFLKIWHKQCSIMVATDLASRGLDYEDMDLVINCDAPCDLETYVHRSGRAGRFGSKGYSFTLLGGKHDYTQIIDFQRKLCFDLHFIGSEENLKQVAKGSAEIQKLGKLMAEKYETTSSLTPEEAKRDAAWLNFLETLQSDVNLTLPLLVLTGIHIPVDARAAFEDMGVRKSSILDKLYELRQFRKYGIVTRKKTEEIEIEEGDIVELSSDTSDESEEDDALSEVGKRLESNSEDEYDDSKYEDVKIGQNTSRVLSRGIRGRGRGRVN